MQNNEVSNSDLKPTISEDYLRITRDVEDGEEIFTVMLQIGCVFGTSISTYEEHLEMVKESIARQLIEVIKYE
ncbi:MAG: hypothetical protein KAG37_03975 [Flavobacteriales bacterium]|nr:hypothetical protein [Flavobacteriales bacterium]